MPEAIESAGTIPSPISDHNAIYLHVNWKQSQIKNQNTEIWDDQNGNYNAINNELNNLVSLVMRISAKTMPYLQPKLYKLQSNRYQ